MSIFKPPSLFILHSADTASLKIEYERSSFPTGEFGKLFTNQADMKLSHKANGTNLDEMVFIRAAMVFLVPNDRDDPFLDLLRVGQEPGPVVFIIKHL